MTTLLSVPALTRPSTHAATQRRDRLRATIALLGGHCDWSVDSCGWIVTLHLPQERTFAASTLEAALEACVDWLMAATTASPYGPITDPRAETGGTRFGG